MTFLGPTYKKNDSGLEATYVVVQIIEKAETLQTTAEMCPCARDIVSVLKASK
jgi:hypothetical protein